MSFYLTGSATIQPARRVARPSVFAWLLEQLAARRDQRRIRQEIRYLRMMDRHVLNDMGLDIARLHSTRPCITAFNPVSVMLSAIDCASRHDGQRTL